MKRIRENILITLCALDGLPDKLVRKKRRQLRWLEKRGLVWRTGGMWQITQQGMEVLEDRMVMLYEALNGEIELEGVEMEGERVLH